MTAYSGTCSGQRTEQSDSLSLVSVYGKVERAIFYITNEGKAGVEVYDKSGGRHYIVGNS